MQLPSASATKYHPPQIASTTNSRYPIGRGVHPIERTCWIVIQIKLPDRNDAHAGGDDEVRRACG